MEGKRKNLVTGNKESTETLTLEQCTLRTMREVSKSHPAGIHLENCTSQGISEVTSSEVHIMMLSDSEAEEVQQISERATRHDYKEMYQTGPQESSSKMNRNGSQNYCYGKLQFVEQIMQQITDLPLDHIDSRTTALRCQGLLLIEDLSQVDPSLWSKEKLLSVCIASIFALPSVDTLQRQDEENANVQALYNQTVEAMEAMLKCLLSKNRNTTELFLLLEQVAPWMTSAQAHERARAVNTYVFLLKFAATCPMFHMSPKCPRLGVLISQLCLRLNDPKKKIGQQAMEGLYFLYSLIQHERDTEMTTDSFEEEQYEMSKQILGIYNPVRPHQNVIQIIKEFEPHLTSKQMADLLLTAIDCLKEANRHTAATSHTITSVIMECYKQKLHEQVPEIVDKIYQQLGSIYQFRDRQIMLGVMSSLAHTYMAEVCNALLNCPFPIDRFSAEMWYVLAKTCSDSEITVLVNILLKKLQLSPKATGNYTTPLAAASAFCKLLSMPKCSDVALYIYPRLLMALLVQVHYNIRHNVIGITVSQEEYEPVSYVVMALKTLLLSVRCYYEFAVIEKEQGWELLTSCEDHHRGVGLLARTMLQNSYYFDLQRILYLLVPFLERGDEEHQITATAFFIEILYMPEARRLPEQYSFHRLNRGLMNEIPVIRALCIKGLVSMADWPRKDVNLLLPTMTKGLSGMDGRLFVESVAEIEKILDGQEEADCICNITLSLQELFSDNRESVRASAIYLFGKMLRRAKKNNKLMIRQQVLESMVPLFLHLQEENSDISKKSKYALEESFHFLGWKPPKQIVSSKAWYEHEDIVDETCLYLVEKQQGALQRFLYQGIFYTESPLLSIKRASIMFLGFLVLHMDNTVAKEDLDLVSQTLEGLMHDPEVSVCVTAAHAHDRVFAVLSKQKNRLDDNNMTATSDTGVEKLVRNSRSQNAFRNSGSSLFRVLSLWKSANNN
ncbi:maestro heat-like repeat-containing protein family member 7 isoform X2 [Sceloporus undulatus]|uniref:maestro heat-like repeat-containing protein family member 7 isoform X2 n=1 Tax=Sceloporus undulatus TaxID=8520 RepID=UPI001C4B9EF0|nr:maestro heat-like repeat-containing protein family member 7 isoform X2 [Sceloporus undulatus]